MISPTEFCGLERMTVTLLSFLCAAFSSVYFFLPILAGKLETTKTSQMCMYGIIGKMHSKDWREGVLWLSIGRCGLFHH